MNKYEVVKYSADNQEQGRSFVLSEYTLEDVMPFLITQVAYPSSITHITVEGFGRDGEVSKETYSL